MIPCRFVKPNGRIALFRFAVIFRFKCCFLVLFPQDFLNYIIVCTKILLKPVGRSLRQKQRTKGLFHLSQLLDCLQRNKIDPRRSLPFEKLRLGSWTKTRNALFFNWLIQQINELLLECIFVGIKLHIWIALHTFSADSLYFLHIVGAYSVQQCHPLL